MGVNIRLHLTREGEELAGGAARGATLELVFEKEEEEEAAEIEVKDGEVTEQQVKKREEEEEEEGCEDERRQASHVTNSCSTGPTQTPHSDPNP